MSKELGRKGEKIAENYLINLGLKILDRNFCIRGGEIDLIFEDNGEIVFIEVKTRQNKKFGEAVEQISERKKELLINSAQHFLEKNNLQEKDWRIDVITVEFSENPKINHIKNAIML